MTGYHRQTDIDQPKCYKKFEKIMLKKKELKKRNA